MTGLDVSRLAPSDAATALRTYPRRFRGAVTALGADEHPDDIAHRPGPDGRCAAAIVADVARRIALLADATRRVLVEDSPSLDAAVLDPAVLDSSADAVDAVLDRLTAACTSLADSIGGVDAGSWSRSATITGAGRTVTALDLVREGVRAGADGLKAAEAAMAHARGQRPS